MRGVIGTMFGTLLGDVSRETFDKLDKYVGLLRAESEVQNLVARSTLEEVWDRHIADSAQLLKIGERNGNWVDVGSGAGLPGLVLAVLGVKHITLVEPRRLRAEFLQRCLGQLVLTNATVVTAKIEQVTAQADVITARAVAPLSRLLEMTRHLSHRETVWVLPKGKSGRMELEEAQRSWQGRFRLEPSITQEDAVIIVASEVQPRQKGRG